jgi:hypothetical protein
LTGLGQQASSAGESVEVNFLREEQIMAGAATTMLGRLMERNVSEVFGERDPGQRQRVIAEL